MINMSKIHDKTRKLIKKGRKTQIPQGHPELYKYLVIGLFSISLQ